MGVKFQRNYALSVGTEDIRNVPSGAPILIQLPFTVEFEIVRNILSMANNLHIRIYNLNPTTRNKIRYNFYDTGKLVPITFNAGYGTGVLPQVFTGNITQAWSEREGSNFVTTIEAFDGGFAFANATTNLQFTKGTPQATIISTLAGTLSQYNVAVGALGSYPGSITRGNSYSGSTTDLLNNLTNGGFFIDNGKINCLGNSECLDNTPIIVNAASGLLGTPILQQTILSFDMLFEPSVGPGQQISLQSIGQVLVNTGTQTQSINGLYKAISIKHRGMISAAVCGDAVTSLEMFYGTAALTAVPAL